MNYMKKNILKISIAIAVFAGSITSCKKTLDLTPTNDITADQVYSTAVGYKDAFAKVYGSFALNGNSGPAGNGDIQGIDEGTSDFLRLFWNAQELSTDEAIDNSAWSDPGLHDYHNMNWTSSNAMLTGLYDRSAYQITLCNEFIRQCSDANLSTRGITGASADSIRKYIPEARFLRAFQYWALMDVFANPPFADETNALGSFMPKQIKRADLFNYIGSELRAISSTLPAPKTNEYGRADQAAANALLARMYLNAAVYTGTVKYDSAIIYSKKVIDAGYSLETNYNWLMRADNYKCNNEFILTINYDGQKTQNWCGTTYIINAGCNSDMGAAMMGVSGWGGNRTTKNLPNLFPDYTGTLDQRSQFFSSGHTIDITDRSSWTSGFAVSKFRNVTRTGAPGSDATQSDVDFPLFRLAEQYLIYAEAVLRSGTGGDAATALSYINKLRDRAYGNTTGEIGASSLTIAFILDERARELYWEGFRRTDLIRYNKFVESTYLWPWKAGIAGGAGVDAHYKIYPIPSTDINSNTNLVQNTGY